jgi:hypothetical protein
MTHNPSERDDSRLSIAGQSLSDFYRDLSFEMRKAGGEALFAAAPELEEVVGPFSARCIAAEIFRAMIKAQKRIVGT